MIIFYVIEDKRLLSVTGFLKPFSKSAQITLLKALGVALALNVGGHSACGRPESVLGRMRKHSLGTWAGWESSCSSWTQGMKIAGKRMWERSKLLVWECFCNPYKTWELFNNFCNLRKMPFSLRVQFFCGRHVTR